MKKLLCIATFAIAIMFNARAEEGMWLPYLLGEKVYKDMVEKGLKLSKEQLYSINNSSVKDAVIIFGNGCTGEIVSDQGLIFTNHHCGYGAIAEASSVEHNYLRDGFWATDKKMEIPARGLTVQFLKRVDDITDQVEKTVQDKTGSDRTKALTTLFGQIEGKVKSEGYNARVVPMYKANQYFLFVYEMFTDIRLVGTAPESIGKFGGDTDNFEWPRHTGDFSVFRVYASKNNKPAPYAVDNVPMKPKHFLPISLAGVKDGDYAMIFGNPGRTNRYETSLGIQLATDINNPSIVDLRDMRLKYMLTEMKKDPATKLQLASRYAMIANYWKFYGGERKQLLREHVYESKIKQEKDFQQWAKGKIEFENLMPQFEAVYNNWRPYAKQSMYLREGILGAQLTAFARQLSILEDSLSAKGNTSAITKRLSGVHNSFLKEFNRLSEQHIVADAIKMFYTDIDKNQQPVAFYANLKNQFGDLNNEATYEKYAENLFNNTMILDSVKWNAFITNPTLSALQADPAYTLSSTFTKHFDSNYKDNYENFMNQNDSLGRLYMKGIMQMNKGKDFYPDANFTMRLTYGAVKSYEPRDAVHYDYVTTMKGIMEKYVPGDYEFDLPKKAIELYNNRDFGQYIDPTRKDLVVGFITTNDIIGGNSGSPVINAKGELIGLAFDGNYESLSCNMSYDIKYNRTICVDIRYVLWCIDKLGGAKNIINELKIVK